MRRNGSRPLPPILGCGHFDFPQKRDYSKKFLSPFSECALCKLKNIKKWILSDAVINAKE
jgi:hypothetical protein